MKQSTSISMPKTLLIANSIVRGAAKELRNSSDRHKTLPNNLWSKAQFPD